jgi:hypothetical protein
MTEGLAEGTEFTARIGIFKGKKDSGDGLLGE